MSPMPLDVLERHLQRLPREAWERPEPPPRPWPTEPRPAPAWRGGLRLRPLIAAGLAAVLLASGFAAGLLLGGGGGEGGPRTAAVRVKLEPVAGRGRGAQGTVRLEPHAGGLARVELSGLRPSSRGDFYELWLLGADGKLVSLGSLRVPSSGRATARVELPVDPGRFRFFDVSREPADGNPSHSTISVLRGPAT